jgi:N-hydroxyarylamine O-acetyltransferase
MSKLEIAKYFERINYNGTIVPTLQLLNTLQKLHLLSVPFENLDIHYKIPIELDLTKIFEKVVNKRRGGFCYELNGLFYELLKSIGFHVKMVSARVFNNQQQTFSPEFDHLTIIAKINSTDYLVDVGFGEFAFLPLRIELNKIQDDERGSFRIEKYDDEYYKVSKLVDENWMTEYMFSLRERDLSEFKDMCLYHQTSPHSHFTQSKLCSLATEKGRITVTADKIKIKEEDTITELPVSSEEEFLSALKKYFNIGLHENVLSQPA